MQEKQKLYTCHRMATKQNIFVLMLDGYCAGMKLIQAPAVSFKWCTQVLNK